MGVEQFNQKQVTNMKTFEQLTAAEQTVAVDKAIQRLVEQIAEERIHFNDALNGDNLQARINAAWKQMERLKTPWFIGEAVMETCGVEIRGMAQCNAEDAIYSEPGEFVVHGVVDETDADATYMQEQAALEPGI